MAYNIIPDGTAEMDSHSIVIRKGHIFYNDGEIHYSVRRGSANGNSPDRPQQPYHVFVQVEKFLTGEERSEKIPRRERNGVAELILSQAGLSQKTRVKF